MAFYRRQKDSAEPDWRVPSVGMRWFGIIAAAFTAIYGAIGVLRNDLNVSLSKSGLGVHLHGFLAWLCFVGMMMMSVGVVRFLSPPFDNGIFDFAERRRRFGPIFFIGLGLYFASQAIAGGRS
jgi:hypothetical protein